MNNLPLLNATAVLFCCIFASNAYSQEAKCKTTFECAQMVVETEMELKTTIANMKAEFESNSQALQSEIQELKLQIAKLNERVGGIRLVAKDAGTYDFACSGQHVDRPDSLIVMYGSRDGTGCSVRNLNYMKELNLSIPNN
jgi:nanoRNase/pAp phosphatase (c-di-AMP/oligoRNAs hydrolase)